MLTGCLHVQTYRPRPLWPSPGAARGARLRRCPQQLDLLDLLCLPNLQAADVRALCAEMERREVRQAASSFSKVPGRAVKPEGDPSRRRCSSRQRGDAGVVA